MMNDVHVPATTRPFDARISDRLAWTRDQVSPSDWLITIPDEALDEVEEFIRVLSANPVDVRALCLSDYRLDACRALMARVREVLDQGVGMAVLDRLPVASHSKEAFTAVYWLLSSMIARPVAQSFDGRLLYDVRDTGLKTSTRVRSDLTNQEISWHSDYGFNFPPPYLGLLVLRVAKEGGVSKAASMMTAHNVLRERRPDLLQRLYEPFYWNRQGEHPEGDPVTHQYPVFQIEDGRVRSRFNPALIPVGYRLMGLEPDQLALDALREVGSILSDPANHISFVLEAGQIQYVNNYRLAHLRTDFVDYDEPDAKRHLVRIFLRDSGRRSYMG